MEIESKSKFEQWWSQLVWESERDFVSPYTMDECVRRLKALDEKYHQERSSFFNLFNFHIQDLQDHGDHFSFKMDIHMSKAMLSAELFGKLIYKDQNSTQVKMRSGITLFSALCLVLLVPLIAIVTLGQSGFSIETFFFLAVLCVFYFRLQISFGYGLKPELYHEIHKELAGDTNAINPV